MPKLKEKCGILASIGEKVFIKDLFTYLEKIQHRGRESFGITFVNYDTNELKSNYFKGLIKNNIDNPINLLESNINLLHTRYSTSGKKSKDLIVEDCMPKICKNKNLEFAFAFNGNIPFNEKYKELECLKNFSFENYQDTNLIKHFLENFESNSIENLIIEFVKIFDRSFSLIVLTKDSIYFAKDRFGVKPLCIGKNKTNYIISSESCALPENYTYLREVTPGEISVIKDGEIKNIGNLNNKDNRLANCLFEYIYFMNEKSRCFLRGDESIFNLRYKFGLMLAKDESQVNNNSVVLGVPSTGISSSLGFSDYLSLKNVDGIVKNPNSNRTFILENDYERQKASNEKYIYNKDLFENKDVYVIDDSLVRGITLKNIVKNLKINGAKKIHLRISSPEIKDICKYGVDIPTKKELFANKYNNIEMTQILGVSTLRYLDLENMINVFPNDLGKNLCTGCINSDYRMLI